MAGSVVEVSCGAEVGCGGGWKCSAWFLAAEVPVHWGWYRSAADQLWALQCGCRWPLEVW